MPINRRQFLVGSSAAVVALSNPLESVLASPRSNLYVPAEESPHELTFMQWPVNLDVYGDKNFLALTQRTIAEIASTISEFEPVVLLADASHHRSISRLVSEAVELWDIATDDLWCRDSGPLFAKNKNGDLVISHIKFNGWGNRQAHTNDGRIVAEIARHLSMPVVPSGLVGEAGGVDHDGQGLLIAHESSWLNPNRNPGMSRDDIEERLLAAYGADTMIWAPGLGGEDITDYHIDSLARFTGPGRVLINLPDNPDEDDVFHMAALETHDLLKSAGLLLDVIPEPEYRRVNSLDFVASYVNYYVCNGAVVTAEFGDEESDEAACRALQDHYPGREVVSLNVDALGDIGGGIHCATQQMPR